MTLHERGLVYRGTYMVNWAPQLQTAVSDLEVEYSEEPGTMFHFKYPLAGSASGEFLPVATTRPETILGDTAVAVHPEDPRRAPNPPTRVRNPTLFWGVSRPWKSPPGNPERVTLSASCVPWPCGRYAQFVGKQVVVPMSGGRTIPVIADDYVDREFGTGALKITPGHDPNDYAIGQRTNLPILTVMNKDGTMAANCGKYAGLDRAECRKALWGDMTAEGLVIKGARRRRRSDLAATAPHHLAAALRWRCGGAVLRAPQGDRRAEPLSSHSASAEEPYTLRVPRSQRGGEIIEPLVSEQWFVKMDGMATDGPHAHPLPPSPILRHCLPQTLSPSSEPIPVVISHNQSSLPPRRSLPITRLPPFSRSAALKKLEDGELRILPQRFEKVYTNWLSGIQARRRHSSPPEQPAESSPPQQSTAPWAHAALPRAPRSCEQSPRSLLRERRRRSRQRTAERCP